MLIFRLLGNLAALCAAGAALAQNVASTPGSACVPSDVAITGALHATGVGSVRFATGATGTITLFCPLARFNSGTTTWNLKLTYQDSNGTDPTGQVLAQIYMTVIGTSAPVLLTSANSNTSASTAVNTVASPLLTHTFDFDANVYWIRITLKRDATNVNVTVHNVVLDGTVI